MGLCEDSFRISQDGGKTEDYAYLTLFLVALSPWTTLCLGIISYIFFDAICGRQKHRHISRTAALDQLVSTLELEEDLDEKLLDICVEFCMKEDYSNRHEITMKFDRVKGVGDQDEVYRHYLKLQLRRLEEEHKKKTEVDTDATAAAENQ